MTRLSNIFFLVIIISNTIYSQEVEEDYKINILRPSKAAFYSAVIPGLGQIYNDKLWKVPLVYAALGISGYSYDFKISLASGAGIDFENGLQSPKRYISAS